MRLDVLVAGSLHLDILVTADRLPQLDETLMGSSWGFKTGGKGGNQAIAAARAGAKVGMIGAVGDDAFGRQLLAALDAAAVDRSLVRTVTAAGSGISVAIVDRHGDYAAVVVSGVNAAIAAPAQIPDAAVLLLQNEIPESASAAIARQMKQRGSRIVLNAAPARLLGDGFAELIDLLVVNRVEAGMLAGTSVVSIDDAMATLDRLASKKTEIIITLGGDGYIVREIGEVPRHVPARPVKAVSSHGAGDTFCGTLTARLANGLSLIDAAQAAGEAAGRFVAGALG